MAECSALFRPTTGYNGRGLARDGLFCRLRHLFEVGRIAQVDRGVRLEGVGEAEFLADFPHRRHDFLAEEADAGARVLVADAAVIAPQPVDARTGFFEDATQL